MMSKYKYLFVALLAGILLINSCSDDDIDFGDDALYPPTTGIVNSSGTVVVVYEQTYTVSGKMESSVGMRDIYATLVRKEGNKIVEIDKNQRIAFPFDGNPNSVEYTIVVPITAENATDIKIVGLNTITKTAEEFVEIEKTVHKPVISFSRNLNTRRMIGNEYPFSINGIVTNDADIISLSFAHVVNGVESTPVTIPIGEDPENIDYRIFLTGRTGMSHVIFRAENQHGGFKEETFYIEQVSDTDFIDLLLTDDLEGFEKVKAGEDYITVAEIFSGSGITAAEISLKRSENWESPTPVQLPPSATDNEYESVDFPFHCYSDLEAIRLIISNGSTTEYFEFEMAARPAKILLDIEMSTDPDDEAYFLGLWEPNPVFGRDYGLSNQDRIDWVLTSTGSGVQPISPHAYGAGASYFNNSKPYLFGFDELTYVFISNYRGGLVKEEVAAIETEFDIRYLLRTKIIEGENYNIPGASRRVGPTLNASSPECGIIIGWGDHTHPNISPAVVSNTAFAIAWIKKVEQKENGHWKMTFDFYFTQQNQRLANNRSNIVPYPPYTWDQ